MTRAEGKRAPRALEGRSDELRYLQLAAEAAARGEARVLLLAGPAGVGKTALVQELRNIARTFQARFACGRFDGGTEKESSAIMQALEALGRLLNAAPAEERAQARGRILRMLGADAGLARVVPAFGQLLAHVRDPRAADPAHAAARVVELAIGILRATASAERPAFIVLEDLQWSGPVATRFIQTVLAAAPVPGLLVLGTMRDDELARSHPLAAALARWREQGRGPEVIRVENLSPEGVARLLRDELGAGARVAAFAQPIYACTTGNPYETIELVRAVSEALASAQGARRKAQEHAVLEWLAHARLPAVLRARIERLPAEARALLFAIHCLGADTNASLALTASGLARQDCADAIAALRREGLLAPTPEGDGWRIAHRSVREAIAGAQEPGAWPLLHLAIARRLTADGRFPLLAAEQYAAAGEAVTELDEAKCGVMQLQLAAANARGEGLHRKAARLLRAALALHERLAVRPAGDQRSLVACETQYHLALYSLGELEEADILYMRIASRGTDAFESLDATCVQVASLSHRGRVDDALSLGLRALGEFGIEVETNITRRKEFTAELSELRRWAESFDLVQECSRADAQAPPVLAAAKILSSLQAPAFYKGPAWIAWLVFRSHELWMRHGPCGALAASLCRASIATIALNDDWRTGYLAVRNVLDVCEQRGWEPETSLSRYYFALSAAHWFEPLERKLREAERAREGLLAAGDPGNASFCARSVVVCLLDGASILQQVEDENESALVLAVHANNRHAAAACLADRQMIRALRAAPSGSAAPSEPFDPRAFIADAAREPAARLNDALRRAIVGAILGDVDELWEHSHEAIRLVVFSPGFYQSAWVYWLTGVADVCMLANAGEAPAIHQRARAELDGCIAWLRGRAIDAPQNFRHLHLHLVAERDWACGRTAAAVAGFDEAIAASEANRRPWHHALITERAGRLHQSLGWKHSAAGLLAQARSAYFRWGATAKVRTMAGDPARGDAQTERSQAEGGGAGVSTVDVLRASQALMFERSTMRLKDRVEQVLRDVTGAPRVLAVFRGADTPPWRVRDCDAPSGVLPLAAFRYAETLGEPLVLDNALADDRFSRDPYFKGMERCSVMVVPVMREGEAIGMLLLEDRGVTGAFSISHADAVMMIAAQLAVSLESARLYEQLERQVREQTEELRESRSRLIAEAQRAGMAQIATNVLHNVGNVLNSVNVSAHVLNERVRHSRVLRLKDIAALLDEHAGDLRHFFASDERGRLLPGYLHELGGALASEQQELLQELDRLGASVDHVKRIVAMQQSYAGASGVLEPARVTDLIDDALRIQEDSLSRHHIDVVKSYGVLDVVALDKTRVMQILVNLFENARHAMQATQDRKQLRVEARQEGGWIEIRISDTGCGIPIEHIDRIFSHGFTTKPDGHGFGLHSCALAAREMGGGISAHSDGRGKGATFILELPA